MFKTYVKNIVLVTIPAILILFAMLELAFRFVIPAAEFPYYTWDGENQIIRFDRDRAMTGVYTVGKLAQQRGVWRINNMGWNSDIDYMAGKRDKPLIAIIGDSYIEGLQVDTGENVAARLREMLDGRFDVYAFGVSGASLSQYFQMSRHVRKVYDPEILVFTVVHNDFLESLCRMKYTPGMMCLEISGSVIEESGISPYVPSRLKRILRHSSLVRYVYLNLGFDPGILFRRNRTYDANIDVNLAGSQMDAIEQATGYILKKIKEENPGKTIIFIMDAPRNDIYEGTLGESKIVWMNRLLARKCGQHGLHFIDLTGPFQERYAADGVKFQSEYDAHWNERGHMSAAEVLFKRINELAK